MLNKKILGFVFLLSLVLPILNLSAADYLPKNEKDIDNVIVNSEELSDGDFYIAGGTVLLNPEVKGDLFTFGSSINILGGVKEDLFALGGSVIVVKPVMGDARVGGGNVAINSEIGEDLLVGGSTVFLDKNTSVGGDLWALGQTLNINGNTNGNAKIFGNQVVIDGIINGNLEVRVTDKLTFGPNSKVLGSITYTGEADPVIEDGAQIGDIEKLALPVRENEKNNIAVSVMALIFQILTLFVTVLILVKLFQSKVEKFFGAYSYPFSSKFWKNVLVGLGFLIVVPVVGIILILSMVGVYLGLALLLVYIGIIVVSLLYSNILLGIITQKILKKDSISEFFSHKISWKTILVGTTLFYVLCLIPVLGSLVIAVLFMSLVGAIVSFVKARMF